MGKGEDGMDALEDDDDDDEGDGKTRRCLQSQRQSAPHPLVLTLTDEQAALVAPESNQLLHLQLRKRYYAEALNFMRTVEGAMCVFFSCFPFSPCFRSHPRCFTSGRRLPTRFLF